jgi:outer membrane protein assembly factor BamA
MRLVLVLVSIFASLTLHSQQTSLSSNTDLWSWAGLPVREINFTGVTLSPNAPLTTSLPQLSGAPLDPEKVRQSLRLLYASGLYRNVQVEALRQPDGVHLTFAGTPRFFIGTVNLTGVRDDTLTSLLSHASKLDPGTAFSDPTLSAAMQSINRVLIQNGYHKSVVTVSTSDAPYSLRNIIFHVVLGPQSRVGVVTVTGDPGLDLQEFRRRARLHPRTHADHDTITRALSRLRVYYQKHDHLEAALTLVSQTYQPTTNTLDLGFHSDQGPVVRVLTDGMHVHAGRLKRLIPIYEEGAVDDDLLNEGARNLRDDMQRDGYFDARVDVKTTYPDATHENVVYTIDRGIKHKVGTVDFTGNHAFSSDTLSALMRVKQKNVFLRSGLYSQQLLSSDVSAIEALYHASGYIAVKVTPKVDDTDERVMMNTTRQGSLRILISIAEGPQQHFGQVDITGAAADRASALHPLLKTISGNPFSLTTLSADRDAINAFYQTRGFSQVRVELQQTPGTPPNNLTDIHFIVDEGQQVITNQVIITGLHYTRPRVVNRALRVRPGSPLDQNALMDSQRNLYDLALFNEVNIAVENPAGNAPEKNILVQLTEAKRWDFLYGVGFEAETGEPSDSCPSSASLIQLGINPSTFVCSPLGSTGASERVSLDITRSGLFGRDQSVTLGGAYGSLEKRATFAYDYPHLLNKPKLDFTFTAGYINAQDVTTFASSQLQGAFRISQKFFKADTMLYEFDYRRVQVNANTLQVSAALIPLLSQPVRVGGPGVTWVRDTRTPTPLDADRGSFTSFQEFFAASGFGSEADFNRVDLTNSTYYHFGKLNFVLARSTRIALERTFGAQSLQTIPLPERLYAGGANSLRGFPINAAGPRDLQTGYPVGGTGAFVNSTELRLPAAALPIAGQDVSFVLFHDMGNVFINAQDIWPSILHYRQPDVSTCTVITNVTEGTCNFNFFSHDVGIGARYKTPVGPLRLDFSYNLNPPLFPVLLQYNGNNNPAYVGRAGHFNFFFSIGQSF